jgi:glycosyltransferase involved in cell wall biosynthesis
MAPAASLVSAGESPFRVIQLADYAGANPGSFIPLLRATARAAHARDWLVEAVFAETARDRGWLTELADEGIPVRFLPSSSRLQATDRLKAIVSRTDGPLLLHTHFTSFDLAAALAARSRPDVAVFWHIHSPALAKPSIQLRNLVKFSVFSRWVDAILCVAPGLADQVRRRGASPAKVVFFPNAIDVERFRPPSPKERDAARARLGLPADARVLLHFGWDWHRKGGDLFLRATKELVDDGTHPIVALTIGGGEPAMSLGDELGLGSALIVQPPMDELPLLYAAADVFVSPSRAEGMPFAVAEALSSGVPVVASAISGQASLGRSLGACVLTRLDPEAIANGIRSILGREPETLARDTSAARERMRKTMDLGRWAERLVGLYAEAASTLRH